MTSPPTDAELVASWRAVAAEPFSGWDFSFLDGRYVEEEPPWSYRDVVLAHAARAHRMLDLGTGGGEFLLGVVNEVEAQVVATEGWAPNLPVARRALSPVDVPVVEYDAERDPRMPFDDGSFDLVIDRHEAYDAAEIARVLAPGGVFVTQQVDGRELLGVRRQLGDESPPEYTHVRLDLFGAGLSEAGLCIERAEEWVGIASFNDIAALVSFFTAIPWQAPADFEIDRYAGRLIQLQASLPISAEMRRFLIVGRKPER